MTQPNRFLPQEQLTGDVMFDVPKSYPFFNRQGSVIGSVFHTMEMSALRGIIAWVHRQCLEEASTSATSMTQKHRSHAVMIELSAKQLMGLCGMDTLFSLLRNVASHREVLYLILDRTDVKSANDAHLIERQLCRLRKLGIEVIGGCWELNDFSPMFAIENQVRYIAVTPEILGITSDRAQFSESHYLKRVSYLTKLVQEGSVEVVLKHVKNEWQKSFVKTLPVFGYY